MYHFARTGSDPAPLDFNAPRHNSVADAPVFGPRPHGTTPVPALDTAALLAEIGLSAQAIREVQTRSSAPEV